MEKFGRIDYCVNCAGILGNSKPSAETSVDDFDKINSVNYRGTWLSSRAQIRVMMKQEMLEGARERGSIVNIASQLGIVSRRAARTPVLPFSISYHSLRLVMLANGIYVWDFSSILCLQSSSHRTHARRRNRLFAIRHSCERYLSRVSGNSHDYRRKWGSVGEHET